jgi:serine protease AprX
MDLPLKKVLLNNYRHSKLVPCYFHNFINKINYLFKKYKVIVKYRDDLNSDNQRALNKSVGFWQKRKIGKLNIVNSYYARLSQKNIQKLLEQDEVRMVYLDRECKTFLDSAGPSMNSQFAWDNGLSGRGVTTAVIDTGIKPHNDLVKPQNRILAFKDFIKKKTTAYDDNGHGTHVAGDIASNGFNSGGLYRSPAYESSLVGIKALDKYGSGNLSTIISAIEWCIENKDKYEIRIICMSLGSESVGSYKDDLLCQAVEYAWKWGIVVCAAAGNEGPRNSTISSPGIDPAIITVGASNDKSTPDIGDDKIAGFSSRGPTPDGLEKPDLVTPGVNIISLRAKGSYLDRTSKESRVGNYYLSLSGTSMATPLCCSAVSLLLEKEPFLTPDQVKDMLLKSCSDIGYDRNTQGAGCLDIGKLLNTGEPELITAQTDSQNHYCDVPTDTFEDNPFTESENGSQDTGINVQEPQYAQTPEYKENLQPSCQNEYNNPDTEEIIEYTSSEQKSNISSGSSHGKLTCKTKPVSGIVISSNED